MKKIVSILLLITMLGCDVGAITVLADEVSSEDITTENSNMENGNLEDYILEDDTTEDDAAEDDTAGDNIENEETTEPGEDTTVEIEEVISLVKVLPNQMKTLEKYVYKKMEMLHIQNNTYPEGEDVLWEIINVVSSDEKLLHVNYSEKTLTWTLEVLLPGTVNVAFTITDGEKEYVIEETITIICEHPVTIETLQIDTLLNQARKWLGRKESNGGHKAIIDIYNTYTPLPIGYKVSYYDHWCATFVSALEITKDCSYLYPVECGCERMISLMKNRQMWEEDESVTPEAGWIIFYDWNDNGKGDNKGWADHVGIVEKVENKKITVIEGNYDEEVKRRTITVNGKYIRGYGRPIYGNQIEQATFTENGSVVSGCTICDKRKNKTIYAASTIQLSNTSYTYDGNQKSPSVKIKDKSGKIVNSSNYKVAYSAGRIEPGRYCVNIQFDQVYYRGTKNLYFTINPKAPASVVAKLYGGHDDVKVSWGKSEGADGYVVYYKKSTDKTYQKAGTTINTTYQIKNLKDGAKYYFKIIPYFTYNNKIVEGNSYKIAIVYTLKAVEKPVVKKYTSIRVKLNWKDINRESGYQVSMSTQKLKTAIVLTTDKNFATIKASKGKTYYYKVRAYKVSGGKRIYGPWSPITTYKLK